jgi:hypothetical protein
MTVKDERLYMASSYDKWNPWNMKVVCGNEILREIPWDDDKTPLQGRKDGVSWGETNGFRLFKK